MRIDVCAGDVSGGSPVANSRPGTTWSTSSFGSSGSTGGGGAASAAGMSSTP